MQPDPIGYGDGMNWYAYVHDDPVNQNDPTGNGGSSPGSDPGDSLDIIVQGCGHICRAQHAFANNEIAYWSHWALGACSFAPGAIGSACGIADAGVYAAQGRYADAALSAGAAACGLISDAGVCKVGALAAEKIGAKAGGLAFKAAKVLGKGCGCFVEGTEVETPSGLKAIEDIKVGDIVIAYDEQTGILKPEPVTGLIRPEPKPTFGLLFEGRHGEIDTFRATADHPWYTADHKWVHTSDLKVGDLVETATGEDFELFSIGLSGKTENTFNLEVHGLHTFLVGKDHIVVHNACLLNQIIGHFAQQGWNAGKFTKVLGWGSKAGPAAERLEQIDHAAVEAMKDLGLTKGMVRALRAGYADSIFRGTGEGVAEVRIQVLDAILKNW